MTNSIQTGAEVVLDVLRENGIERIFGVPGSSVAPLIAAIANDPAFEYIMCAHETAAVAMADGYSRATGKPSFVNLYMLPGTANGLSMLYNAFKDDTPLVVTVGQQATSLRSGTETVGEADLVSLASQFTKLSTEVNEPSLLRSTLRQAFTDAESQPKGPAFVSIPEDLFRRRVEVDEPAPTHTLDTPPVEVVAHDVLGLADLISASQRPLFVAGGQVTRTGGSDHLVALAKLVGATLCYETFWNDRLAFPSDIPNAAGDYSPRMPAVAEADLIVGIGCRMFHQVHESEGPFIPEGCTVAHIDLRADRLARNHAASVKIGGEPGRVLELLVTAVQERATHAQRAAFGERQRSIEIAATEKRVRRDSRIDSRRELTPLHPDIVMAELAELVGKGYIVVDEAVTAHMQLISACDFPSVEQYYSSSGAVLGWGAGASLGIQMALPDRRVIACLGDGATMFGLQALWSARAYDLPVIYLIVNNGAYASTRFYIRGVGDSDAAIESGSGFSFAANPVDFVSLAAGMGMPARSCSTHDELRLALAWAANEKGPCLVEAKTRILN